MLLVFVSPVGATCSNYTVTRLSRLACVLLDKVQVPCALEFYNFTRICLHVANGASVPAVCVLLPPFASNSLVTLGHETVGTLYSHVLLICLPSEPRGAPTCPLINGTSPRLMSPPVWKGSQLLSLVCLLSPPSTPPPSTCH